MKKYFILLTILLLISCKKDEPIPPLPAYENGVLVLNEGLFQQNNSSITFYENSDGTTHQQVFNTVNGRGLGDTANDMVGFTHNGTEYIAIAVDVSSQIEIIEAKTLESVAQISLFDTAGVSREPRALAIHSGNIYSANFDGTVTVIEMGTWNILKHIDVGENPNGITATSNSIFVANSGGLNAPDYDSTISVIDPVTNTVISSINAYINCSDVESGLNESEIFTYSPGDYNSIPAAFLRINGETMQVEATYQKNMACWSFYSGWIYYVDADDKGVYRYHTTLDYFEGVKIIDASALNTPYCIYRKLDRIFIADANNYVNSSTIYMYDGDGNYLTSFTAGLNANTIIINE